MADTTVDNVKAIASHLKSLSDSDIQMYIDDAKMEVDELGVAEKYHERLQRYLVAHYASLNIRRPEARSFEGASVSYKGPRETTYGSGMNMTEYGQEYQRLLRKAQGLRLLVL
ncbi:DUF4054 domain-containing protein [Salibacterium sp. K-3]